MKQNGWIFNQELNNQFFFMFSSIVLNIFALFSKNFVSFISRASEVIKKEKEKKRERKNVIVREG